jgi:hypothetical protein
VEISRYSKPSGTRSPDVPRRVLVWKGWNVNYTKCNTPLRAILTYRHRCRNFLHRCRYERDERWGLDDGTWSVLCHMYPHADVPVAQLSIDETQPPSFHFDAGRHLALLREEGVLVLAAATSCTTFTPMLGAGMCRNPTIGRFHPKPKFVSCFSQRNTNHSST